MGTSTISQLVGSSQYQAVSDDALKDEDNAAWVMELEPTVRKQWIERIGWIRLVDRLAENQLFTADSSEFDRFYQGWQSLLAGQGVDVGCPCSEILTAIQTCWFTESRDWVSYLSIDSWDRYLKAIARYHCSDLRIDSLQDYETMLADLAGSFFQVLPFLSVRYWQSAYHFGVLDQFYNNLRDLQEDAEQGICYFPSQLLDQFGVSREEILRGKAYQNPGYHALMDFWLNQYLPRLRYRAIDLLLASDLHPSWTMLRDWSLHRYNRIERVFRSCHFDYTQFPQTYWQEVRQDLPLLLPRIQTQVIPAPRKVRTGVLEWVGGDKSGWGGHMPQFDHVLRQGIEMGSDLLRAMMPQPLDQVVP